MMDDRPKSATETFERRSEADAIKILGDFGAVGGLETLVGNGDDAAVFRSSSSLVFCVDALVEGQDFRRDWATFSDIGWKLGATNLSDLAAMGATPLMGFLTLGLPDDVSEADLEALRQGLEDVWHPHGQIHIAGGDLSRTTGPLWASLNLVGQMSAEEPMRRCSVKESDLICVSGVLGEAAAGLHQLESGMRADLPDFRQAQLRPTPRVSLGTTLARSGLVKSAIDLSDGLLVDIRRLVGSEYGATLSASKLPVRDELKVAYPTDWLDWALKGGEDFELIFCVARDNLAALEALEGIEQFTVIGEVKNDKRLFVDDEEMVGPLGFDHFQSGNDGQD